MQSCGPRAVLVVLTLVVPACGSSEECSCPEPTTQPSASLIVDVGPGTLATYGIVPRSVPSSGDSTAFVVGPATPPMGTGSVRLAIGTDGAGAEELRFTTYHTVRLDQINLLSYSTYISAGSGKQAVYILMHVDWNNDGNDDDLLFFEPDYQHAYTVNVPDQGDLVLATWQTWNARAGGWWSLSEPTMPAGGGVRTLDYYLTLHPDATVVPSDTGLGGLKLVTGFGPGDLGRLRRKRRRLHDGSGRRRQDLQLRAVGARPGQRERLFVPRQNRSVLRRERFEQG